MVVALLRDPKIGPTLDWYEHTRYFIARHTPFKGARTDEIAWHGNVSLIEAKRRLRAMRSRRQVFYVRRRWWTGWVGRL